MLNIEWSKQFMIDPNSSIYDGYSLYFKSALAKELEKVKILCIPEIHAHLSMRIKNAKLIDLLVKRNPHRKIVVLVESVRSLVHIEQRASQHVNLCQMPLTVKGWDIGPFSEYAAFSESVRKIQRQFEQATEDYSRAEAKHYFNRQEDNTSEEIRKEEAAHYLATKVKIKNLAVDIGKHYEAEGNTEDNFVQLLIESFQTRNNTMIESIRQVLPINDMVILIAGERHLIPDATKDGELFSKPEMSLEPLYQYLNTTSAVVLQHLNPCPIMYTKSVP